MAGRGSSACALSCLIILVGVILCESKDPTESPRVPIYLSENGNVPINAQTLGFLFETVLAVMFPCRSMNSSAVEIRNYSHVVNQIVSTLVQGPLSGQAYDLITEFTDHYGARMSGSPSYSDAAQHLVDLMKDGGIEEVHMEPVTVPRWIRGEEHAMMTHPRPQPLHILGFGFSVPTPSNGISAEAIVVRGLEDLQQNATKAEGRIVIFNPSDSLNENEAIIRASKLGAVAVMWRSHKQYSYLSMRAISLGSQYRYSDHKIPAVIISADDVDMLTRIQQRGVTIEITLRIVSTELSPVTSYNLVGEMKGWELPHEIVILAGHLDSWDHGPGGLQDSVGAFVPWYALYTLHQLGLRPRRTIRAVLFTGEEEGLLGANAYFLNHTDEMGNTIFALATDTGHAQPTGLRFLGHWKAECIMKDISRLMFDLNAVHFENNYLPSTGTSVFYRAKVPIGSLFGEPDRRMYLGQTLRENKRFSAKDVDRTAALAAAVSYIIADLLTPLPR